MKRFLRSVCIILIMAIFLNISVTAAENVGTRESSFFMCHTTYLNKITTRQFEVWFDVVAVRTMDELGVKRIKVQRSSDGVTWTTMKTFEKEDYSQMIAEDMVCHYGCVTYWGTPGYYYRAAVCYYAKNSSGIGEYDTYSDTILL